MYSKKMTYTDFGGTTRTETFYFNLSEAELMKMELGVNGGFAESLQRLVDSNNGPEIMKEFDRIILASYGELSDDGRRFIKSDELSTAFSQTQAYSDLFTELSTNADAASEFVLGIVPANAASQIRAQEEAKNLKVIDA